MAIEHEWRVEERRRSSVHDGKANEDEDDITESEDTSATIIKPLPSLLRRRSTRRLPVYTSHHVMLVIEFSNKAFCFVWVIMLAVRLWCIFFLVSTAKVYWFVAHPYMSYYASLIGSSAVAGFQPFAFGFGFVAVMHAYQVYKMVWFTIWYQKVVLGPPPSSLGPNGDSLCFRDWRSRLRSMDVFMRTLKRDFARLFFDRHGPYGVESSSFFLRLLTSEVLEISTQATQVYHASMLISKAWLNHFYIAVTVVNCWATPFVQFIFYKLFHSSAPPAVERVTCLITDFILDTIAAMVIPMLIFMPYVDKFDFSVFNFELACLYDDVWFTNMVMENRQLLAQNGADFLCKIIPHWSIYFCLNSIRALIRPRHERTRVYCEQPPVSNSKPQSRVVSPVSKAQADADAADATDTAKEREEAASSDTAAALTPKESIGKLAAAKGIKPKRSRSSEKGLPAIPEAKLLKQMSRGAITRHLSFLNDRSSHPWQIEHAGRRRLENWLKMILVLAGSAVLAFHLYAAFSTSTTRVASCISRTRSWFASQVSCSVVQFNCHMHGTTGVTDADLSMLEPASVSSLILSHCPKLRVPTIVTTFRNLVGIEFYNSTIEEWSADAAVTADRHPRLAYVALVYVNLTQLPDALLQSLPPTMQDLEVVACNLTSLPLNLDTLWHSMSVFYLEHLQLTEFPPVLTRLHVDDLSLAGNNITELPDYPSDVSFVSLAMTQTPLVELPNSIGDLDTIGFLNLGYTQLQAVPRWMDHVVKTATKILVHDTPFCISKTEQEIAAYYGANAVLSCIRADDVWPNGKYPLDIVAQHRLYFDPDMVSLIDTGPGSSQISTGDP